MLTDAVLDPTTTQSLQHEHSWDVGRNAHRLPLLPMVAVAVSCSEPLPHFGRFRGPHPIRSQSSQRSESKARLALAAFGKT